MKMRYLCTMMLLLCGPALADETLINGMFSRTIVPNTTGSSNDLPTEAVSSLLSADTSAPSGYVIGDGINVATGEDKGVCLAKGFIVPAEPSQNSPVGAQDISYSIKKIDSQESLASILSASASGSISAGFGSGSASARFLSEHAANTYSLYLVASVNVKNSARLISNEDLDRGRAAILSGVDGDLAFRNACGDVYVRGMASGGVFYAIYELTTKSDQDLQVLSAAIDAQGVQGTWSASAQFSNSVAKASRFGSLNVQVFYQGPSLARKAKLTADAAVDSVDSSKNYVFDHVPSDTDDILRFAEAFPAMVATSISWDYQAITKSYETLPSWPISHNTGIPFQKIALQDADNAFLITSAIRKNISYIETHPDEFVLDNESSSTLLSIDDRLVGIRKEVVLSASKCAISGDCVDTKLGPIYALLKQIPSRKPRVTSTGGCERDGKGKSRWATYSAGCMDTNTGTIWSPKLNGSFSYDEALQQCTDYVQNGAAGWMLPSASDLRSVAGPDGVADELPGNYEDWFWSADKLRVTPSSGFSAASDTRLKLYTMCKYVGTK